MKTFCEASRVSIRGLVLVKSSRLKTGPKRKFSVQHKKFFTSSLSVGCWSFLVLWCASLSIGWGHQESRINRLRIRNPSSGGSSLVRTPMRSSQTPSCIVWRRRGEGGALSLEDRLLVHMSQGCMQAVCHKGYGNSRQQYDGPCGLQFQLLFRI